MTATRASMMALSRMGFAEVAPIGRPGPWRTDPREALARVLPELAAAVEPVAVYRHHDRWHVAYRCGETWLGAGPPEDAPSVSEEWEELGWRVPDSLARLYAVHDGIGPIDGPRAHWWRDAVLPAAGLFPLVRKMRFGEEGILYRPGDLLLFAPDGRGGGQCFERSREDEPDPPTRSWDVASRALGPIRPFGAFVAALANRWIGRLPSGC